MEGPNGLYIFFYIWIWHKVVLSKRGIPKFSSLPRCYVPDKLHVYIFISLLFFPFFKWCIWVVKSSIFNLSTCLYIYLLARVSNLFKKHCTVKKKMRISYLNNHWLVIFLKENRLRSKLRFWYDFFKSINYYLVKKNFDL